MKDNSFSIEINPTEDTFDFIQALSNHFSLDYYNTYECYYSIDQANWSLMTKEISDVTDTFIFYCNIFENSTYYFKLHNMMTGEDLIIEKVVDNLLYNITLSTYDETDEPIMAYSNFFNINDNITCQVSTDKENWTYLSTETVTDNQDINNSKFHFFTRIYKNATYYFRFTRILDDTPGSAEFLYFYVTVNVTNLTIEDWNDPHYIPTPKISLGYNEENESFVIKTQNILLDKALTLKCLYTETENDDFSTWNEMEIEFYTNDFLKETECNFYFEIPAIGATDKIYRIVFYNYLYNEAGQITIYEFNYDKALDYVENELKVNLRFWY